MQNDFRISNILRCLQFASTESTYDFAFLCRSICGKAAPPDLILLPPGRELPPARRRQQKTWQGVAEELLGLSQGHRQHQRKTADGGRGAATAAARTRMVHPNDPIPLPNDPISTPNALAGLVDLMVC